MIESLALRYLSHLAVRLLPALVLSAAKASLLFALVYTVTRFMKNTSPRLRHMLWATVLVSYPAILAVSLAGPVLYLQGPRMPVEANALSGVAASVLFARAGSGQALAAPVLAQETGGAWWLPAALLLWMAGVVASHLRVVVGRIRLRRLIALAEPVEVQLAEVLNGRQREGSLRRIRVLRSPHAKVPFACGFFRPLIVLPADAASWPEERRRAVLRHELGHVRRGDAATQEMGRLVCSLFWFVPLVWLASVSLYLEQEKACDLEVLRAGTERRRYAVCVLEAARLCRDPAQAPGLAFPSQRRRVLEERIRSILTATALPEKGKLAFAATVALAAAVALSGCLHVQRPASPAEVWSLFAGTWENRSYSGQDGWVQKMVIRPDLVGEDWELATDGAARWVWEAEPKKTWTDWRGNRYCQYFFRYDGFPFTGVGLLKIGTSGRVVELNSRSSREDGEYPRRIDPKATPEKSWYYFTYYRE